MKNTGVFLKLIFIKLVQYMEVCALPYIAGIAAAVGLALKIPEELWATFSVLGVLGTVFVLYAPVIALHAWFVTSLKKKRPEASYLFFLEDSLGEHGFTKGLAVFAAVVSFVFGTINYNFAVDMSHPQHVSKFIAKPWESNPVALKGKIIREPEFRDANVWLYIQPTEIDNKPVALGLVMVKISRTVEGYEDFKYGQHVFVRGQLREPEPAMNPGTFDYKRYLNNRNIFGLLNVNKRDNIQDIGIRESNPLFDISLWVKDKFLAVMKQTLPYPHSAFQGGIIYGLKTGLPHEEHFEFKWAGMAWVLVVAGAHLLMVYLTLKMLLGSIRPNPKVAFCILFVLLIIFLVLTGINPPTVRAFIMIMLYEFTKVFLGQDIRAAVRSAIGIAAFLLLASHVFPFFSPLMIFDPTVTLSFGAVLSLIYLSRPIDHFFRRHAYGLTSVVLLGGLSASLISMSLLRPPTLSLLGWQQLPIWAATFVLCVVTIRLNNRYRKKYQFDQIFLGYNDPRQFSGGAKWFHPTFFTYNNLPKWVIGFAGAQLAIQFGMVLPLSSWYFQRSPVGGLLANVIAFPALGVIIQVGLMAVLIGLIPGIGITLALILNAADYLGIQLLMSLAHYSKVLFPYPMAMKPTGGQILLYYLVMLGFIFYDRTFYSFTKHGYQSLREFLEEKWTLTRSPIYGWLNRKIDSSKKEWACVASIAVLCLGSACYLAQGLKVDHLKVLVMELDDGSGTIVMTPGGSRFLIDAGRVDSRGTFDVGERTVAPVLLGQQIEHIDAVFITSLRPENMGGMPFIFENFTIGRVYVPFDPSILKSNRKIEQEDYDQIETGSRPRGVRQVVQALEKMRVFVRERKIPVARLSDDGRAVLQGEGIKIEALNPPKEGYSRAGSGSVVLKLTYGPNAILLGGDLDADGQAELLRRHPDLHSAFLLIPSHGEKTAVNDDFVNAVKPAYAAVQYRRPPFRRSGETEEDPIEVILQRYRDLGAKTFRTDLNGALMVDAWIDGRITVTPTLETMISHEVDETGADETDTDLSERRLLKSEGSGL